LGTFSKCIILLHAVHDCPGGRTAAIARHVSFAEVTCSIFLQQTFGLLISTAQKIICLALERT